MNIKLAWYVLRKGLPKVTDTIYAQKFVSFTQLTEGTSIKAVVDDALDFLIKQLLTEAAHRIVVTKQEAPERMGYYYTGSLQLGKKGIKTTINRG